MNRRMVLNTVGHIILAEAALLILPAIVSVIYLEECVWAFLITIGIALALGLILKFASRPDSKLSYCYIRMVAYVGNRCLALLFKR